MTPNSRIPAWAAEPAKERAVTALQFLHVHGFVSDGERDKAVKRMRRWVQKSAEGGAR